MNKKFKFNSMFGLKLSDRLNGTYYSILILVSLFIGVTILRLATMDYDRYKMKAEKEIKYKYKEFIARLIVNEVKKGNQNIKDIRQVIVPNPVQVKVKQTQGSRIAESNLKEQRGQIANRVVAQNSIFKRTKTLGIPAKSYTSNLPEVDDFFKEEPTPVEDVDDVIDKISTKPPKPDLPYEATASVTNFDPGDITKNDVKLFNYVVKRKGSAYLDVPEQLVKEPASHQGYRDPDEVERVVKKYSPMIDYCFRKHTRFAPSTRGFIKVAFKISYEGYVIPESVRIVSSSLRNKPLEQCIKNFIKNWRAFKRLDESMGIAQVVQKFVFN